MIEILLISFLIFQMRVPPAMYFGEDCLAEALKHVSSKQRILIVTDEALVRMGYVDRLTDHLRQNGAHYEIFDSVEADPTIETALHGVTRLKAFKPDSILAFGGGSPIDCAKIMKVGSHSSHFISQY